MNQFRSDLGRAADWVAEYLERVDELPVLARVEPGGVRSRLPLEPPERGEPFEAVLRDLDDVVLPGITHWNHPRFFGYFSITGSEPGILAELLTVAPDSLAGRLASATADLEDGRLVAVREHLDRLHELAPALSVTLPVGSAVPLCAVTEAVTATACPNTTVPWFTRVTAVVVTTEPAGFTVCATPAEVSPAKFESPL